MMPLTLHERRALRRLTEHDDPDQNAHPTPSGFVGMLAAALAGALLLWGFLIMVLG